MNIETVRSLIKVLLKNRWYLLLGLLVVAAFYSLVINRSRKGGVTPSPSPTSVATIEPTPSSPPASSPSPSPTSSPVASSPTPSSTSLTIFNPTRASFPDLVPNEKALYLLNEDTATLQKIDTTNQTATDLAELSTYIEDLAWAPNHQSVLIAHQNTEGNAVHNPLYEPGAGDGQVLTGHYNLETKVFTHLNRNITAFAFITNNKIIYQYQDDKTNNLTIAKPDGTDWKNIATFKEDTQIIRAGQTALVYEVGSRLITRYDANGRSLEKYSVPADLRLYQSVWTGQGADAVYWVAGANEVVIKRLKVTGPETIATLPHAPDQWSILWDNKSGDVYLAGSEGIINVATSSLEN